MGKNKEDKVRKKTTGEKERRERRVREGNGIRNPQFI